MFGGINAVNVCVQACLYMSRTFTESHYSELMRIPVAFRFLGLLFLFSCVVSFARHLSELEFSVVQTFVLFLAKQHSTCVDYQTIAHASSASSRRAYNIFANCFIELASIARWKRARMVSRQTLCAVHLFENIWGISIIPSRVEFLAASFTARLFSVKERNSFPQIM